MITEQKSDESQDYFTQKRIELMVGMANKKITSEIELMKKTVNQLEQEIIGLRNQLRQRPAVSQAPISSQQVNAPAAQVSSQQAQPMQSLIQEQPIQIQAAPEKKVSRDAPRFGDYTSEDVSIEKFFNYSGKR